MLRVQVGSTRVGRKEWEDGLDEGLSGNDILISHHHETLDYLLSELWCEFSVIVCDEGLEFIWEIGGFLWETAAHGCYKTDQLSELVTILATWVGHK